MAAPKRFSDLPAPARRYVLAFWTAAGAGVAAALLKSPASGGEWPTVAIFAGAISIAHFMRTPSREHSYMLSGPFVLAASLVLLPRQAAAAIALGLLPEKIQSRSAWYTKLFNYLLYIGGALLAGALFRTIAQGQPVAAPGSVPAGLTAAVTFTTINLAAVALAVKFSHGLKLQSFITPTAVLANLAIDGAGLPMAALWQVHPLLIVLGLIPLASGAYALWMPQLEEELRLDAKTGLYNARFAMDSLHRQMRDHRERGAPLAIIMADLDHLREINNRLGHLMGDRALQVFGEVLKRNVRPDGIAARFGGEEFFVILPDQTAEEAALIAGKIRQALAATRIGTRHTDETIIVTVSMGVAELSSVDHDATDLVHRADMALYEAKRNGRNRVTIMPSPLPATDDAVRGPTTKVSI